MAADVFDSRSTSDNNIIISSSRSTVVTHVPLLCVCSPRWMLLPQIANHHHHHHHHAGGMIVNEIFNDQEYLKHGVTLQPGIGRCEGRTGRGGRGRGTGSSSSSSCLLLLG